ncbi:MAG: hypothetical protein U0V70_17940 [Terriglobia bacterium]
MKPYMYILAVLLVGGGIGYFLGRQMTPIEKSLQEVGAPSENPQEKIRAILDRQSEAYRLHDPLLLYRDCADSYVEINSNSGDSYGLSRALLNHLDEFKGGKSVNFNFLNPEIEFMGNSAVVKSNFSKTSDIYEQQGIKGMIGKGIWILSKVNDHWRINAFVWREEIKQ